jgi:hypothetical protein
MKVKQASAVPYLEQGRFDAEHLDPSTPSYADFRPADPCSSALLVYSSHESRTPPPSRKSALEVWSGSAAKGLEADRPAAALLLWIPPQNRS